MAYLRLHTVNRGNRKLAYYYFTFLDKTLGEAEMDLNINNYDPERDYRYRDKYSWLGDEIPLKPSTVLRIHRGLVERERKNRGCAEVSSWPT